VSQTKSEAGSPVISLYRKDPLQVGDLASSPANYATELGLPWLAGAEHLDVEDSRLSDQSPKLARRLTESIVIVGGGGLTFDYFHDNIAWAVGLKPKALIWWGAGHNIHLGADAYRSHRNWEDLTDKELRYPEYLNSGRRPGRKRSPIPSHRRDGPDDLLPRSVVGHHAQQAGRRARWMVEQVPQAPSRGSDDLHGAV